MAAATLTYFCLPQLVFERALLDLHLIDEHDKLLDFSRGDILRVRHGPKAQRWEVGREAEPLAKCLRPLAHRFAQKFPDSYPLTGNVGPRSVISRKVPARFETCVSGYRSVLCSCGFRMR